MLEGDIQLFIHYESMCIFHYNLRVPNKKSELDIQLVSGFLSACTLFFDELDIGKNASLFRVIRGDCELRLWVGNKIHATVLLRGLEDLDLKAYYELDVLTRSIIDEFETKYLLEIENFISFGQLTFEGIDHFIDDEIRKMKAHMYSAYLMRILGLAINLDVHKEDAHDLLIQINGPFTEYPLNYAKINSLLDSIWQKIDEHQQGHITFAAIVRRVNKESFHIWRLFQVPLLSERGPKEKLSIFDQLSEEPQ